jgi:hypothetical protein
LPPATIRIINYFNGNVKIKMKFFHFNRHIYINITEM